MFLDPEPVKVLRVRPDTDDSVLQYMKKKRLRDKQRIRQENEEKRREQERIAQNKLKVEQEAKDAVTKREKAERQAKQKVHAVICLLRAPGALARSYLVI